MLAYSSINHAGFILLGLEAATARGVSASLYYLFAYTFMVIGTFAIVTVLGRQGDSSHDIASYRGLARRQPALALCLAVLLLAQAGAPFTTGLWAKLQVVLAAVDANAVPLAVVAMVSAAIAAFFYLRVAVLMYSSGAGEDARDGVAGGVAEGAAEGAADAGVEGAGTVHGALPLWSGIERSVAVVDRLNASLVLEAVPSDVASSGASSSGASSSVGVPVATAVAIGLCVAVTLVFGIIPAPVVDFAHRATLLFIP